MTYHESLTLGIADVLADVDAQIVLGLLPSTGDTVAINFYSVEDHGTMTDTIQGVQLAVRADSKDSRATPALSEEIFDRLHGLTGTDWHGVPIVHAFRNSSAYLGTDEGGRHKITDNYYVRLSRAGRHRTDT